MKDGLSLRLACCSHTPLEVVQYLVEQWPDAVKLQDRFGKLPLHYALHFLSTRSWAAACSRDFVKSKLKVVQFLVDQWPESILVKDSSGRAAVHSALSQLKNTVVASYLVQKWIEVTLQKIHNESLALYQVCHDKDLFPYLIEQQPDLITTKDCNGNLPLHVACRNKAHAFLLFDLVKDVPETVKVKNNAGMLPLHLACASGASLQVLQYLVWKWPKSVWEKNNDGQLPLHLVCSKQKTANLNVVQYLVRIWPHSVCESDNNGRIPLQMACASQANLDVIHYLVKQWPESVFCLVTQ